MSVFVEQWISYTYTYPLLFRFFSRGATESFQKGKGVRQSCIFSPCLINLFAQYIMRNAGLDEAQARFKIARRNLNNLSNADDTTVMAEKWKGTEDPLEESETGK